jgi:hypothetical protein
VLLQAVVKTVRYVNAKPSALFNALYQLQTPITFEMTTLPLPAIGR